MDIVEAVLSAATVTSFKPLHAPSAMAELTQRDQSRAMRGGAEYHLSVLGRVLCGCGSLRICAGPRRWRAIGVYRGFLKNSLMGDSWIWDCGCSVERRFDLHLSGAIWD